jgi:tRNA pseudouridine(55) synthase
MKFIYKPSGYTINQFINTYKEEHNIKKLCFCGRLDPMARGEILILENEECKQMPKYLNNSKKYNFEILLSLKTDSDDPLGIIEEIDVIDNKFDYTNIYNNILNCIYHYKNNMYFQKFHNFSSKRIDGKPLWYYKKNNIQIETPSKEVDIFDVNIHNIKTYEFIEWKNIIISQIDTIDKEKDFNQDNIITQWKNTDMNFLYSIPVDITVSSGFYVRQFVRDISDNINYPLLTFDINRTKILTN